MATATIHLLRHGEVFNPEGVLYGRLPDYHLSDLGARMADRAADYLGGRDIRAVVASPLVRAQETAAPLARALALDIDTDRRVIEAANEFEGLVFTPAKLLDPSIARRVWNPLRPSWGEPYADQALRMCAAIATLRARVEGHEGVIVSHQLPIWVTRLRAEGRRLWHDPRRRECALASVTSLRFDAGRLIGVDYSEPARDLLPDKAVPGA
ncbi:histidine phosphatase family protein [Spelaeicoccus albus]|uniref:Broad specificity phosphatase PhoE n=1 Tax=Spelaeicoccus albus TaxID=1280376 RepID=A0A7Z0D5U5_9MICO|nr:histidine phosphatase family protein [Spelaeicoccus albus]NYI69384.1 broad specificity phosphatase PhoE [Spelaeicoccus albus]